jgi:uncharacterized membrane protein YuzA (DUF378 family)
MPKAVTLLALGLVIVGALNWGLVGMAEFDLVATLFGGSSAVLSRIVYSLVGLAAVVLVVDQFVGRAVVANRPTLAGAR